MASVSVSFRASPELFATLEALVKQSGKDRAAVVAELVQAGLEVKKGTSQVNGAADDMRRVLEALEEGWRRARER